MSRAATAQVKRDVLSVGIDKHIVERDYQTDCIDTLCREIQAGRRKLLVEIIASDRPAALRSVELHNSTSLVHQH